MVKLQDISIYFTSSCCKKQSNKVSSKNLKNSSLSELTPNNSIYNYFLDLSPDIELHAATITIGNKHYGRMSAEEQYFEMKDSIKKFIPFHSKTQKYIFEFELQNNGQLHAHGIIQGVFQNKFIESFYHFGRRNSHNKSYQDIKHVSNYIDYICKERIFPTVHNIKKHDVKHPPHKK